MSERSYNRLTIPEQRKESRRRHEEKFGRRMFRCRSCKMIVDEQTSISHLERCSHMVATQSAREELLARYFEEKMTLPSKATESKKTEARGAVGEFSVSYLDEIPSMDDLGEVDGD